METKCRCFQIIIDIIYGILIVELNMLEIGNKVVVGIIDQHFDMD